MIGELITIGDELLIGQVINTNAAYIGEKLLSCGVKIERVTSIGDNESKIIESFQKALQDFDLVIVTGGLGPTHDDITKKVLVNFFNTKLIKNERILEHIKNIFEKRKIEMKPLNEDQALVPECCEILFNQMGTAPGMHFNHKNKDMFVMPGVPHEMKYILDTHVIPYISKKNKVLIKTKTILTTGIPESNLFSAIGDINDLTRNAEIAFLPSSHGVRIRIMVKNEDSCFADNELNRILDHIKNRVGEFVYGEDDITMEELIGKLLKSNKLKLSIAESCTGGLVANRITNVSGCSLYFDRGIITYSNESKNQLLNVPLDIIETKGAVSEEVAKLMARGVRDISSTDIGISTTGIAGPTGGTAEKPVGLIWVGYSDRNIIFAKNFYLGDNRLIFKERASQIALDILRKQLLKNFSAVY